MRPACWPAFIASILAAVMLAGCGSIERDSRPTLRIANWGGAGDDSDFYKLVRQLYADFGKKENCRVLVEGIPGSQEYVSKMLLNYVAGVSPDIVTLDASSAAVFIENGALLDLSPYLAADPNGGLAPFFPNVADIARRQDKVYAVPGDFTPMVVYYNKRLFDQAGVPYPDGSWDFARFQEVAEKLTIPGAKKGDATRQYGFAFSNWMPGWIVFLWNNGADVLSPDGARARGFLDSEKSVRAFEYIRGLVSAGYAPSPSNAAATGVDFFANGQAAMQISGHWSIIGLKASTKVKMQDLGVCSVPTELARPVTVMYEAGLAISKQSKNPDLAWKYIQYFTGREVQARYSATGIAVDGRRDVAAERAADPLERAFLDIIPTARGPWGAKVPGYDFVESMGQQAMGNSLNGNDVRTELRKAAEKIDAYFAIR
jgi:multiple sugar transport system substrate-binding protein